MLGVAKSTVCCDRAASIKWRKLSMKLRALLASMGVSVLVFTGCSQAQTEVTQPVEQVSVQAPVVTEVTSAVSEETDTVETPSETDTTQEEYTEEDLINSLRALEAEERMEYDSKFTVNVDDGSGSPLNLMAVAFDYHAVCGEDFCSLVGDAEVYAFGQSTNSPVESYIDREAGLQYVKVPIDDKTSQWVYQQTESSEQDGTVAFALDNFDYLKLGTEDAQGRPVLIGEVNATKLFTASSKTLGFDAEELGIDPELLVAKVMFHFNRETLALEQVEVVCDEVTTDTIHMFNWTLQLKYVAIGEGVTSSIPEDVVRGAISVADLN